MKYNKFIITLITTIALTFTYATANNTHSYSQDIVSSGQTHEQYRDSLQRIQNTYTDSVQSSYIEYKRDVIARYIAYRDSVLSEFVKHMHKPWNKRQGKPAVPKPIDNSINPEVIPAKKKVKEEPIQDNTPIVKPIINEELAILPQEVVKPSTPQPKVDPNIVIKPKPEDRPKEETVITPTPQPKEEHVVVEPKPSITPKPEDRPKGETIIPTPQPKEEKTVVKKETPKVDPLKGDVKPLKIKDVIELPIVADNIQPQPFVPLVLPKEKPSEFDFIFFGTELTVRIDEYCSFNIPTIDNKGIATAMEDIIKNDFLFVTIEDCLNIRDDYKLCDWAYLLMLTELGKAYFDGDCNEATLLTGYLYCMSGYKMRFAYNDNKELIILFSSDQFITGLPFWSISSDAYRTYYAHKETNNSRLYICDYALPKEKNLSLQINELPLFDEDYSSFNMKLHSYPIVLDYSINKNLIDFFNTYPTPNEEGDFTAKWLYYANTPLSESAKESIYPAILKSIEGKSEYDAVNIIMDWIESYKYEYDSIMWGYDRAFFPDETIFYQKSDCEDHAILFTRIVKDILGLQTALVYYPNHLAAAVKFNGNVKGDYIEHNGEKFTVCDPTIYYGKAGRTMSNLKNTEPTLILFK